MKSTRHLLPEDANSQNSSIHKRWPCRLFYPSGHLAYDRDHGTGSPCPSPKGMPIYPSIYPDKLTSAKADRAAAGAVGGFSFFGGRQEKWENASDLYTQAANAFRLQKQSKDTPVPRHVTQQAKTIPNRQGSWPSIREERIYSERQVERARRCRQYPHGSL